ncbi:hypothetical protein [Clostridium paraputrificum]|uniref:hypothetical protein n=1 Tax=Clostridium paraputrificum TaxID=29363 RepID=UPI000C06E47A|nr:hypothetical protein [Clostridium paraputrificum]DAU44846.1 MAG TPA: hypothetical protein [Caudoviricetes sp.]
MKRGTRIYINDKEYRVVCQYGITEKVAKEDGYMGVKLAITVFDVSKNRYIPWQEIRGSYLAEKISDYAENSFNGQNAIYWDYSK